MLGAPMQGTDEVRTSARPHGCGGGSDVSGSLPIGSGGVAKTQALIDVGFLKETAIGGAPLG